MEGETYIKLFRKFLDWEWYDDLPTKALWIHILLKANYKDKTWHGKEVKRGSFLTSYSSLQSELKLSKKQIERALKNLQKTGEVEKVASRENTLIIATKYDFYQGTGETKETPWGNEGDTLGKPRGNEGEQLKKERKEERKKERNKKTYAQSDKLTSIDSTPEDSKEPSVTSQSEPDEESIVEIKLNDGSVHGVTASKVSTWQVLFPAVDVKQELNKMRAWSDANPSKRKTKRGVERFIVNWLSREQDRGRPRNAPQGMQIANSLQGQQGELPAWYGYYEPAQGGNTSTDNEIGVIETRCGVSRTNTDEDIERLQKALKTALNK